jgi:membrane fusion protein (multidrug efflux system)
MSHHSAAARISLPFVREGAAPGIGKLGTRLNLTARQVLLAGALSLGVIAAGAYGVEWWSVGRFIESTDDAYVGGDVTAIAPHVPGFVAQVLVEDNQRVKKGELLVRLDNRDFHAAADEAAAVVEAKTAALDNLKAKSVLQQSIIQQAGADLAAKQAQAQFARDDDARYQGLMRAVATSRQDVQRAAAADRVASQTAEQARAGVAAAGQQLVVLDTEIAQASADVKQAEASLRAAQLNLGYTELRAPIDGTVANRSARPGAYATAGSELLSIVPARGLWVDANFKESQLANLEPGQKVWVEADVLPGETFAGRVASVAPATGAQFSVLPPENATGNFTKIVQRVPVRIRLDGEAGKLGRLRPGLSVTAEIDTRSGD